MKDTINKVNRRQNRIIAMSKTDKKFISRLYKTTTTKEKQAKAIDNLTRGGNPKAIKHMESCSNSLLIRYMPVKLMKYCFTHISLAKVGDWKMPKAWRGWKREGKGTPENLWRATWPLER